MYFSFIQTSLKFACANFVFSSKIIKIKMAPIGSKAASKRKSLTMADKLKVIELGSKSVYNVMFYTKFTSTFFKTFFLNYQPNTFTLQREKH